MNFMKCIPSPDKCKNCGFCLRVNICHSPIGCIGCLSCYYACPHSARDIIEDKAPRKEIRISVNGEDYEVPERISIKKALELLGFKIGIYPNEGFIQAPCCTGGCWACAVIVDGELTRSCITPVRNGMRISTEVSHVAPLRIVHGPEAHSVGGKATPWWEKKVGNYVEVAIWVAGCNLRCPQCQNYHVTYDNISSPMTPEEAARLITYERRVYGVRGLAISGGEPTLNKRWLIRYFRELRRLNPDKEARLHLDSNGTLLTPEYIDELIEAGCNNIGIEPKGAYVETFMNITGIHDRELAERYLKTSWNAIKYIVDNYKDQVILGVGIPYNSAFMSFEEIYEIGNRLSSIDPEMQVCVLDYFPTFRRRDIKRPGVREMLKVKRILNEVGLKYVIVQTWIGHIGP